MALTDGELEFGRRGSKPSTSLVMNDNGPAMRSVTVKLPLGKGQLHFNPVTSFIGFTALIGLTIWCAVDPQGSGEVLSDLRAQVTQNWTWFYIGSSGLWLLFIVYTFFKYGHLKLGGADEKPEFDDLSYFTMLFAAGVAVGLFFFGVSEPLFHADVFHIADPSDAYPNRFTASPFRTTDEADLYAITLTYYHWAFAAWCPYLIVALCSGLGTYNFGLPLTMRATLYPLVGELTWGWFGDVIDGFSIITVVSGVCTSLGLGAQQLITGMRNLGALGDAVPGDNTAEIVAIWIVTAVATASVVSGLNVGIKILSYVAFVCGSILWFLVLVMDKTSFSLNLMVEGFGSYLWRLPELTFATDAFGQLTQGNGDAENGAAEGWMNAWSLFYISWWISWSSFVGLFVARISKGRSVGSIILLTTIAPFIYVVMWFGVFGGAGLRQARAAAEIRELGAAQGDANMYLVPGSTVCYDPPIGIIEVNGTTFEYGLPGISPICLFDANNSDLAWFNVLGSYYNFGNFLSGLSLVAIAIYFVTSSDSGSLIVDQLASNGRYDHHWIQRVIWASLEGSVATGLIAAGGSESLEALQAASIIAGLPFTLVVSFCCVSITQYLRHMDTFGSNLAVSLDEKDRQQGQITNLKGPGAGPFDRFDLLAANPNFAVPFFGGVFNVLEWIFSAGQVDTRRQLYAPLPDGPTLLAFAKGMVAPFVSVYEITQRLRDSKGKSQGWQPTMLGLVAGFLFLAWIACFAIVQHEQGILAFAWLFFFSQAIVLAYLRYSVRKHFFIPGNMVMDFLTSLVLYPQVLCQMEIQLLDADSSTQAIGTSQSSLKLPVNSENTTGLSNTAVSERATTLISV